MKKSPTPPNTRKKQSDPVEYARYSGIAFQLIAIVMLSFLAGYGLDNWLKLSFPIFKLSLSFLGVILALYFVVKEISKPK